MVRPADVDETAGSGERPDALVARLAATKAGAVTANTDIDIAADDLVIAADTVVVLDGHALGKPRDPADARAMLAQLSGRDHRVCTGVHVRCGDRDAGTVETTTVTFRALSDREINAYVATGAPLDKAGGYGIQDAGGAFVDRIDGSDSNVMGLPLATVVRLAAEVGVELLPR